MRRVSVTIVGFGLAAAVSACGGSGSSGQAAPTATVTVTPGQEGSSSTPAPAGTGAASPVSALPPPITGHAHHVDQIISPSHNIQCSLSFGVECSIQKAAYVPVPSPADCQFDWSDHMFTIGATGGVRGACRSDTSFTPSPTELAYGDTTIWKGRACQSQEVGMICWDIGTRHGFQLARESYHLF
jgi:hypothetical protein